MMIQMTESMPFDFGLDFMKCLKDIFVTRIFGSR